MPNLPVSKQGDLYFEFDRADHYRDEAQERADGTESSGSGFQLSTSPYFARVYAHHKDVTDRQRANQDSVIRLDQSATRFVMQKLMIKREIVFRDAYFATSIWDTDTTGVATGPTPGTDFLFWDRADATPIADIRFGKQLVHSKTGFRPNRLLLGRESYDALLDNDDILDRIKGGATVALPALVMQQRLMELFELEFIHIMDGVVNTANIGATEATGFIGSDNALLYYAPATVGLEEPTAGLQFSWTGLLGNTGSGMRIKRMRADLLDADRIEGEMAFDYKVTGSELGYFFSDTVSPAA